MPPEQPQPRRRSGPADLEQQVQELRFVLLGVDGSNGLRSRVAALEDKVAQIPIDVANALEKVQVASDTREEVRQREHRSYVRFSITIGVTLACALISALAIVLTSSGHAG